MITTYLLDSSHAQPIAHHPTMREAADALPQGAYTTFRTYSGNRVLRFDQHLTRLEESMSLMDRPAFIDRELAHRAVREAVVQSSYPESRIRLTFARNAMGDPVFYITVEPFTPYPPALYQTGVACITVPLHRQNPHAKSTAFNLQAANAYRDLPTGIHEGLMVADDGSILEGLSSNFFTIVPPVHDTELPELRSEEARVLIGVTRSLVLECAQGLARYSPVAIHKSALPHISECFLTSVSREIMPVVRIDDQIIGSGAPGPITLQLMARFMEFIASAALVL